MDKKMLRSVPRPVAKPEYISLAKNAKGLRWLLSASEEDGIIQIVAWKAEKLRKGDNHARYRMFFSDDDYITQDLSTEKTKWLKGKLTSTLQIWWWSRDENTIAYADTASRKVIEKRYPPTNNRDSMKIIDDWQNSVLARKLSERHEKELQHTREMTELVPELPADFEEWIHEYAMRNHRYLLYDADTKNRMRYAFCTHCEKTMEIDSKKIRLRMNELGECPECGSTVWLRTVKRFPAYERANKYVAIIQRLGGDQILVRYFHVSYSFRKSQNVLPIVRVSKKAVINEVCREFITGDKVESFEFTEYKQTYGERWCPDTNKIRCADAVLYTLGLRETLAGTIYQYCGLEVFQEHEGCYPIPLWRYLNAYPQSPKLEMLVKAGLTRLATELVNDPWTWRNGERVHRALPKDLEKLSKPHRKMLRNLNGGESMIKLLREMELSNIDATEVVLGKYIEFFGTNNELVRRLADAGLSVSKFTNYMEKQVGRIKRSNSPRCVSPAYYRAAPRTKREWIKSIARDLAHDWEDYIGWCKELRFDLKDEYVLLPPDLVKAHDRVLEDRKKKKDERIRKQQEKMDKEVKKIMADLAGMDPMHMKSKKYMILLPKSADDLRNEGNVLHHCVGSYVDRVAAGKTLILFIRKVEEPDVPFFTMEWRDNKVIQCRGKRNCGMPADVKAFIAAFEKKMHEDEEKQRVRVS